MLTPLTQVGLRAALARSGANLKPQAFDAAAERLLIYAPSKAPAAGYGVLVFIPPWDRAILPPDWAGVLDRAGVVFVTAAHSGNTASTLGRRIPLALTGLAEVRRRYQIDQTRVYIGGMSGGSRVAMRVALGYPDVFTGAFLNAGSDTVGTADAPLPPRDLAATLQTRARWVLMTGERDELNANKDLETQRSLGGWCMTAVDVIPMSGQGHELAGASGLAQTLALLAKPRHVDESKLAACRARLDAQASAEATLIQQAIARGDRNGARDRLKRFDAHFGGWVADRSAALDASLSAPAP